MRKNIFEDEVDRKILMKHNLLVKAKYSLNLVQNRIFEILLYYFQKEKEGILSCEISRSQLKRCIGKEIYIISSFKIIVSIKIYHVFINTYRFLPTATLPPKFYALTITYFSIFFNILC